MKNDFVKLTNAVYKLLEFFPEADPLKIRAKEKALAIMENLTLVFDGEGWVSIGDFLAQNREKAKLKILEDVRDLLNYFEVSKAQGWLSDANCLIISNGYEKIKKEIGIPARIGYAEGVAGGPIIVETSEKIEPQKSVVLGRQDPPSPRQGGFTARQRKIIEFLENNPQAQVADLIAILPDVTKRTIRRDLDELLKTGRIARMGEYNQVVYKINKIETS